MIKSLAASDYVYAGLGAGALMMVMDGVWLQVLQKQAWSEEIRRVQGSPARFRVRYAALAYVVMLFAVLAIVVPNQDNSKDAAAQGAALGFAIYGVFDFTNLAIFERYGLRMAIADILWGTLLFCVVSVVAVLIAQS